MRWFVPLLVSSAIAPALLPAQQLADLRDRIERYQADSGDLARRYDVPMSPAGRERQRARLAQERDELAALPQDRLGHDARVDWLLFDHYVRRELQQLDDEQARDAEIADLLPFGPTIVRLCEQRRDLVDVDAKAAAVALAELTTAIAPLQKQLADRAFDERKAPVLLRAADRLGDLRRALRHWFDFRDGYDPQFSWWARKPFEAAAGELDGYEQKLRERNTSRSGDSTLVGDPIGEAALLRELAFEWIPYTPAELIAIAEREFTWCDAEMAKAAQELGCGDDWRKALALVKDQYKPPGDQPALIRDLARQAIDFVEKKDLVTVPDLAKECWRMSMMSPQAQRVNPFFLGGDTIQVSFPTDAMTQAEKLQSLRSNNEHFCRATVFHEVIPGHWLQQYSQSRYRTWRGPFGTPFWTEGWALYWEMRMYDLKFAPAAADRVGALYWRKHRCARIVFSLKFHLGEWTGRQCVDYLIDRVGHEPAAAEGEVRRSVSGGYGPLYQAGYMLGGLQIRRLHDELVKPGSKWTERRFHDEILQQNAMPIAVLRAALGDDLPPRELTPWRFADR